LRRQADPNAFSVGNRSIVDGDKGNKKRQSGEGGSDGGAELSERALLAR